MAAKFIIVVCARPGGWKAGHQPEMGGRWKLLNGWHVSEIVRGRQGLPRREGKAMEGVYLHIARSFVRARASRRFRQ